MLGLLMNEAHGLKWMWRHATLVYVVMLVLVIGSSELVGVSAVSNLARLSTASASTVYCCNDWVPSKAIDGQFGAFSMVSTEDTDKHSWLQLDLGAGKMANVEFVKIWNRNNEFDQCVACRGRLNNFELRLGNVASDPDAAIQIYQETNGAHQNDPPPFAVSVSLNTTNQEPGRYFFLRLPYVESGRPINIMEIETWGDLIPPSNDVLLLQTGYGRWQPTASGDSDRSHVIATDGKNTLLSWCFPVVQDPRISSDGGMTWAALTGAAQQLPTVGLANCSLFSIRVSGNLYSGGFPGELWWIIAGNVRDDAGAPALWAASGGVENTWIDRRPAHWQIPVGIGFVTKQLFRPIPGYVFWSSVLVTLDPVSPALSWQMTIDSAPIRLSVPWRSRLWPGVSTFDFDSVLVITGGQGTGSGGTLQDVWVGRWSPTSGPDSFALDWTELPSMPFRRHSHGLVTIDQYLYAVGGRDETTMSAHRDVWVSPNRGLNWMLVSAGEFFPTMDAPQAVAIYRAIVVAGDASATQPKSDTWIATV